MPIHSFVDRLVESFDRLLFIAENRSGHARVVKHNGVVGISIKREPVRLERLLAQPSLAYIITCAIFDERAQLDHTRLTTS